MPKIWTANGHEWTRKQRNNRGRTRIYADRDAVERCRACEADSGRHRGPRFRKPSDGTVITKLIEMCTHIYPRSMSRPTKTRGGDPSASHPPSLKLRRTRARQRSKCPHLRKSAFISPRRISGAAVRLSLLIRWSQPAARPGRQGLEQLIRAP